MDALEAVRVGIQMLATNFKFYFPLPIISFSPYSSQHYANGRADMWMSSGEETKRRDFYTCVAMVRKDGDKSTTYKWSRLAVFKYEFRDG